MQKGAVGWIYCQCRTITICLPITFPLAPIEYTCGLTGTAFGFIVGLLCSEVLRESLCASYSFFHCSVPLHCHPPENKHHEQIFTFWLVLPLDVQREEHKTEAASEASCNPSHQSWFHYLCILKKLPIVSQVSQVPLLHVGPSDNVLCVPFHMRNLAGLVH